MHIGAITHRVRLFRGTGGLTFWGLRHERASPLINSHCCGPPPGSGFPIVLQLASCVVRFSCMCSCSRHWTSRINGLSVHTHALPEVSEIDRSPRPCWSPLWASRFDGLPGCMSFGLRRGPASKYVVVLSMSGLPRGRASPTSHWGPPAWTGLPVSVEFRRGPPGPTGFPYPLHWASGVDRLLSMSLYCRCRASRVDGLPLHTHRGLRRGPASPFPVDLC